MSAPVLSTIAGGVAQITLNRPEKRNALDRATIALLSSELQACATNAAVRLVQITGAGNAFCAGADLTEMQAQAHASEAANLADAEQLAAMLAVLDSMPKPTLARVNGDGYGGALGLLGACDIVVAVTRQNSPSPRCASASYPRSFLPSYSARSAKARRGVTF
jgi:methylglutaconyl-CoA hydratase